MYKECVFKVKGKYVFWDTDTKFKQRSKYYNTANNNTGKDSL